MGREVMGANVSIDLDVRVVNILLQDMRHALFVQLEKQVGILHFRRIVCFVPKAMLQLALDWLLVNLVQSLKFQMRRELCVWDADRTKFPTLI